jgi:hypothetical protein
MKITSMILAAGLLVGSTANADTIASCRKRNPYVYTSFSWTEIERHENNELLLVYGVGTDDQMLEIYFDSPLEQVGENQFYHKGSDYELSAQIVKNKLSFTLKAGKKTIRKKNYECI